MSFLTRPGTAGQVSTLGTRTLATCFYVACFVITAVDFALIAQGVQIMAPDVANMSIITPKDGLYIAAGVALVVAAVKAAWMSSVAAFMRNRMFFTALAVTLFAVAMHTFSAVCAIGYSGSGRDSAISSRKAAQSSEIRERAAYENARARLSHITETGDTAALFAESQSVKRRVADLEAIDSRRMGERACFRRCQAARKEYARLLARLGQARARDKAQADMVAAQAALDKIGAPQSSDPQADALAKLMPWDWATAERIGILLPLLFSLVVEFGAPVCGLLASGTMRLAHGNRPVVRSRSTKTAGTTGNGGPGSKRTKRKPVVHPWSTSGPDKNVVQMRSTSGPDKNVVRSRSVKIYRPRSTMWTASEAREALALADQGLTEREIEYRMDKPKTTVHRMLVWARNERGPKTDQTRTKRRMQTRNGPKADHTMEVDQTDQELADQELADHVQTAA